MAINASDPANQASYTGGVFTVNSRAGDIYDSNDSFEFAYVPMALWMVRRAGIPKERILNFRSLDELTMAFQ